MPAPFVLSENNMAFTFDSTIGSATGNSYVSVEESDDYFDGTLDSTKWGNLSTAQKEQLLTMATTRLESESYGGYVVTTTQRLQFPRSLLVHRNTPVVAYYAEDEVPKEVQTATYELGMYFLKKSLDELGLASEYDQETLSEYAVGPLTVKIREGMAVEKLPSNVVRALSAAGPGLWSGSGQKSLVRG